MISFGNIWATLFAHTGTNFNLTPLTNDNCNVVKLYCKRSINISQCGFHVTKTGLQRAESNILLANVQFCVLAPHVKCSIMLPLYPRMCVNVTYK